MIVLVVAAAVAAGVVVDASAAAETRATENGPTSTTDAGGAIAGALVLKPGIAAAIERAGLALSASYAPQLSMVTSSVVPAILNSGDVRAQIPLGQRLLLRAALGGSIGDLDPGTVQGALSSSAAVLAPVTSLSFGSGNASVGAAARLTRLVTFDVDARGNITGSPGGSPLIPGAQSAGVDAALAWQVARNDALTFGGEARNLNIDKRGAVAGAAPTIGWRHQLGQEAGLELRGGLGAVNLDTGTSADDGVYPLPVLDARAHALLDFAGASKLEISGGAGVDLSNDPLGALLEDRILASFGLGYRATRQLSFHVDTSGFYSAFVKDLPTPVVVNGEVQQAQIATALVANRGSVAWAFADGAAVELAALTTSRLVNGFVTTDATIGVSVSGTMPIYHAGDRPEGSDPRAGRDIGVAHIGTPPPPGSSTIEEVEPLPEEPEDEGDVGAPVAQQLRAPPPNVPIVETPLKLETLKRAKGKDKDKDKDKKKKPVDDKVVEPVAPSAVPPPATPPPPAG